MTSERDFQQRVLSLAHVTGWLTFHVHDSRRQVRPGVWIGDVDAAGFPDVVFCHKTRGDMFVRELKSESGRLSGAQAKWLDRLVAAGIDAGVWRPSDMTAIQERLSVAPTGTARGGDPSRRLAHSPAVTA